MTRMVPIERRLARATVELAVSLAGDLTELQGWERQMLLALTVVRGLALTELFEPRSRRRRDPWPALREQLLGTFRAVKATAASGVATWKLKLSSRYRRTPSASCES